MTCEEFERVLSELGDSHGIEQEQHLQSCSACSGLVSDLESISQQARLLKDSEEPSPWVWNSIEIALREEGLIRQPAPHSAVRTPLLSWKMRWLTAPLAAVLVLAVGLLVYERGGVRPGTRVERAADTVPASDEAMPSDDQQLLNSVAERMPSMRAAYEANLRSVNAYIRDAERSAHSDPNDEEVQQALVNAYAQRAMVYEMALDRSLP